MLKTTIASSIVVGFFSLSSFAQGQSKDSLSLKLKQVYLELDSIFNTSDTSSVVGLIDGFLNNKKPSDTSRMAVRLSYNSNISAMNQTLGIRQFGFSPGVSYYHKTGLYADISTYWSKQFIPLVYLTTFSAGYLKAISKNYLFNLEYTYFLYPNNDENISTPYTNSINFSNQVDVKHFQFKLDYYYYFGTEAAHRILPNIGFVFEKKDWHKIKRLSFSPSITIMLGTESTLDYVPLALTQQQILDRLKTGGSLYKIETITAFGLMNYAFNFPLSLRTNHWVYQLSYTYNIPKSLPDEQLGLTNTGYISASIARYISLK